MIKRIGQNRSMRPSNRQKFKGNNRASIYDGNKREDKAIFKEFPEKRVNEVVRQIRDNANSKKRKELIFLSVFILIISSVIFYLLLPSNDKVKRSEIKNHASGYDIVEPIEWNGKSSEPLKIPDSDFFYMPVVSGMEREKKKYGGAYPIYPPNMIGSATNNVVFFNKDTIEIHRLLPRYELVSFMRLGPFHEDCTRKEIIYWIAKEDSNRNGIINGYDKHALFVSDLDGRNLEIITDKKIRHIRWLDQGQDILIEFERSKDHKDSLYGIFDIRKRKLRLTNKITEEN